MYAGIETVVLFIPSFERTGKDSASTLLCRMRPGKKQNYANKNKTGESMITCKQFSLIRLLESTMVAVTKLARMLEQNMTSEHHTILNFQL
jgi:hypothetical protein